MFYLFDCMEQGETTMLKELSKDGPKAYHAIIQAVIQEAEYWFFLMNTPHQLMKVIGTRKVLLQGEILMSTGVS